MEQRIACAIQSTTAVVFFVSKDNYPYESGWIGWGCRKFLFNGFVQSWFPKSLTEEFKSDFYSPDAINVPSGTLEFMHYISHKMGKPSLVITDAIHNAWRRMHYDAQNIYSICGNVDEVRDKYSNLENLRGKTDVRTFETAVKRIDAVSFGIGIVIGKPTGDLLKLVNRFSPSKYFIGIKQEPDDFMVEAKVEDETEDIACMKVLKQLRPDGEEPMQLPSRERQDILREVLDEYDEQERKKKKEQDQESGLP